jgi:hypothetical protein
MHFDATQAHIKPNAFQLIMIQAPTLHGLSHIIALTWDRTVELQIAISMNLQFKKVEEVLTAERKTFVCGPILH